MTSGKLRRFTELLRTEDLNLEQRRELLGLHAEFEIEAQHELEDAFGMDHSGSETMRDAMEAMPHDGRYVP